jgi:hypothetical protein
MKETTPKDTRTVENTVKHTARVKDICPADELDRRLREEAAKSPFTMEPCQDELLNRAHVNVLMAPGVPSFLQDSVSASPYELCDLIRHHDEVHAYYDRAADSRISYSGQPEDYMLPYVFPTAINFKPYQQVIPQSFFYTMRIDVGSHELAPGEAYIADRSEAEAWRDLLFVMYPKDVRVSYVAPSQDAVYLICQGEMKGGYGLDYVNRIVKDEQETMKWNIRRLYEPHNLCPDITINACKWAYLAHDPDARWRGAIRRE